MDGGVPEAVSTSYARKLASVLGIERINKVVEFLRCHAQSGAGLTPSGYGLDDLTDDGFALRRLDAKIRCL